VRYLRQELGVHADEVEALTQRLYFEHGTTMAGLVAAGHKIDYDHFHSMVGVVAGWGSRLWLGRRALWLAGQQVVAGAAGVVAGWGGQQVVAGAAGRTSRRGLAKHLCLQVFCKQQ